jgi:hypothetical protein
VVVTAASKLLSSEAIDFPSSPIFERTIIGIRAFFMVGIATLITGSALIGNYKSSKSVSLGLKLAKAGYVIIASVLSTIFAVSVVLWFKTHLVSSNSKKV